MNRNAWNLKWTQVLFESKLNFEFQNIADLEIRHRIIMETEDEDRHVFEVSFGLHDLLILNPIRW